MIDDKLAAFLAGLKQKAEKAPAGPWFYGWQSGRCEIKHRHGVGDCDYRATEPICGMATISRLTPVGRPHSETREIISPGDGGGFSDATGEFVAAFDPEVCKALVRVATWADAAFIAMTDKNVGDTTTTVSELQAAVADLRKLAEERAA